MKLRSLFTTGVILLALLGALAACNAVGTTTWNVQVGGGSNSVIAYGFYPSTLQIHAGDTVAWRAAGSGKHTVTFLNGSAVPPLYLPLVERPDELIENPQVNFPTSSTVLDGSQFANSGALEALGANSWSLTFQHAGSFVFTDLFAGKPVTGTVIVENSQNKVPTQAEVDAQGRRELQSVLSEEDATRRAAQANFDQVPNDDGTTTYHIQIGATSADGRLAIMEFFPADLTIAQHDTVTWTVAPDQTALHTITFLGGQPITPFLLFNQQPNGRMLGLVNPAVMTAVPNPPTSYGGNRYFNSGLLGTGQKAGSSYTLNFALAGRYSYTDLAQTAIGMNGVVGAYNQSETGEVAPANQTVTTASYKVHFLIGPNQTVINPDQIKTARSGQVLVSGQAAQPAGNPFNYYIQVAVTDLKSGQRITTLPVTIQVQNEVTDKIQTLDNALMHNLVLGEPDLHYGNNIFLEAGNYTITVQLGTEAAKFHISVLPPRPLPSGPGGPS